MVENKKILLICGKGTSSKIVYNALEKEFGVVNVIVEDKESTKIFLKRRIKKLGIFTVIGQLLFQIFIVKFMTLISKNRIKNILEANELDVSEIPEDKTLHVSSINNQNAIDIIKTLQPDLIVINGTRIISKKVLNSSESKFINTHAGITPKYRGVHGMYWALVNDDLQNSGVTVHFIDEGVDTGKVISQERTAPTTKDNFVTYPLLQLSKGIILLKESVGKLLRNEEIEEYHVSSDESKQYYHPTIFQYFYYLLVKGVK